MTGDPLPVGVVAEIVVFYTFLALGLDWVAERLPKGSFVRKVIDGVRGRYEE